MLKSMKKIPCILLLCLLSSTNIAQNVYDFSGEERPTEPEKHRRERMTEFNDFPYLHLRLSPSLTLPLGALGASSDAPESGFAGMGWGYNADMVLYIFHWERSQSLQAHSIGLSFRGGWSKYSMQEAFSELLNDKYSNNTALATRWEANRADWRGGHFGIGFAYLFLMNQRFMFNVEAMFGGLNLQAPDYRVEQGNYIPPGYGSFFGAARLPPLDDNNSTFVGIYQCGIGYMMTKRWGIKAGVELMHGVWLGRAERFLTVPAGEGVNLQRTVEEYRKPFVALNFQVGLCLSLGGRWEDLLSDDDDD